MLRVREGLPRICSLLHTPKGSIPRTPGGSALPIEDHGYKDRPALTPKEKARRSHAVPFLAPLGEGLKGELA